MASAEPCTLTGGSFQDSTGNLLANGYLECYLSQDASVGDSNICSGIAIIIQLDANANAASGSQLWGNDLLTPQTFYRVTGYTAQGQVAWGPNNQQVVGSSFDLGTWVPNQVFLWTPASQASPPQFTVANLPSGVEGQIAYATNGLKSGETTGNGTGVPVYFSNGEWRVYRNDSQVQS